MTEAQAAPGAITEFRGPHRFLSSFYDEAPFRWTDWTGKLWIAPTREHAFQASKTIDREAIHWVMIAPDAHAAKARGRKVPLIADWNQVSRSVMLRLVLQQYGAYPELCRMLAATAPAVLIEGNTWGDDYWGAVPHMPPGSTAPMHSDGSGHLWYGQNWLGRILMMARDVLT